MSLLRMSNVMASYGTSQALFGVDLDISHGEVVALMGRNGMGKSTIVKCICRILPSKGEMLFDSQDLSQLSIHRAACRGIGLVPEGRRCFKSLTVYENLVAAQRPGLWNFTTVVDLFPVLGERKTQLAASLSGGEQQMLAIGRALLTNPRLLILDEATEGLAPLIRQQIWTIISKLKHEAGLSILVIDKSLKELRAICDKAIIIERGRTVWAGHMRDLSENITAKYLGI